MELLGEHILNFAELKGVHYADVRIESVSGESLRVSNGRVINAGKEQREGVGIRVLIDGSMGFACSSDLTTLSAEKVLESAMNQAKMSSILRKRFVHFPKREAICGNYTTNVKIDPFRISTDEKLALLFAADKAMHSHAGIQNAWAAYEASKRKQLFLSTEGSHIEQTIITTGCGERCTAIENGEMQTRSYPNRFGRDRANQGWEYVIGADLELNGHRIAEQALQLVKAPPCPAGVKTIILDGAQVALTLHETCGHATEMDRLMGLEMSLAGGSFLSGKKFGKYIYGSKYVNVTSDPTIAGGVGSYGFDSEGTPARSAPIIREGIYVGALMNREEAELCGCEPTGTARAMGWMRAPITRMANFNLEPGSWKLEDLISDTKDGLYMELCRSLSIDTQRYNFQFGPEIAWEIKNGKLGRLYRNPLFTGVTPIFWGSCDGVCNRDYWKLWSTDCGKGEPNQNANVGHGTAPARFRDVYVGAIK